MESETSAPRRPSRSGPSRRAPTAPDRDRDRDRQRAPRTALPTLSVSLRWRLAGILVLVLGTLIVYDPAMTAGFVWDDDDHFTENDLVTGSEGMRGIWMSSRAIYYPLILTTWRILHNFWGLNPFPYHLVTILFHIAVALLFWMVLRRLRIPGAWLAGALFALHPVHVESVAWATELKNTQSAFFYLLSIYFFVRFHERFDAERPALEAEAGGGGNAGGDAPWAPVSPARARMFYAFSIFLFVPALLSKPSTVMLPPVLLLLVWWKHGRWRFRDFIHAAPYFLLSAASSLWTIWEQKYSSHAQGPEWSETLLERLLSAGRVVWFYLGKLLWPHPLIFIYPRWEIDAGLFWWYVPIGALAVVAALLLWKRNGFGRPFLLAGGYFVVLLFPVLGFFNIYFTRFSYVGDHFQYLASMGVLALVAAGGATLYRRLEPVARQPALAVCAALLLLLAAVSHKHTYMYKDEETLWRRTVALNPNAWIGLNNLGLILNERANYAEAEAWFLEAIRVSPDMEEAIANLAIVYVETGRYEEAAESARRAIELYENSERFEAVRQTFREGGGERPWPGLSTAYDTLATALVHLDRFDEAIPNYAQAVQYNLVDPTVRFNLGITLARRGRLDDALVQLEAAVLLDPANPQFRHLLEELRSALRERR